MTPSAVRFLGVLPVAFALALGGCGDSNDSALNPGNTVDTVPPAVPVNLQVAANLAVAPAFIDVQWDENSEPDLAGYVLERSLDRGATWSVVSSALLLSADYRDVYRSRAEYRVAAVDLSDNESGYSTPRGWIYVPNDGGKTPSRILEQD